MYTSRSIRIMRSSLFFDADSESKLIMTLAVFLIFLNKYRCRWRSKNCFKDIIQRYYIIRRLNSQI